MVNTKRKTVLARRSSAMAIAPALLAQLALFVATVPVPGAKTQLSIASGGFGSIRVSVEDGSEVTFYEKSYALVFGASAYDKDKGWAALPGVLRDVEAVSAALKEHGFEVEQVLNPTRASFEQAMWKFIGDHGQSANNRLLVYFAGHGATIKTEDQRDLGYLVPCDAPLPEKGRGAFKQAAISMEMFQTFAREIEARHALFVFDSCFSGSLFHSTMRSVPNHIMSKMASPVRQFITAGTENQEVPDRSIFREQFIRALRGGADTNNDNYVTGTELGVFLEDRVTEFTRRTQTPLWGKILDPVLNKGDFIFSLRKPGEAPAPPVSPLEMAELSRMVNAGELNYWVRIANSTDPEDYKAFLVKYPNGTFAPVAKMRAQARPSIPVGRSRREISRPRRVEIAATDSPVGQFVEASFMQPQLESQSEEPTSDQNSWYVILGSYGLSRQDKANALMLKYQAMGYDARLINSNRGDFANFARSLWVVVIGPGSQHAARGLAREIRPKVKDRPYWKRAMQ